MRYLVMIVAAAALGGCTTSVQVTPTPVYVIQSPPAIVADGEVQSFREIPAPCAPDDVDHECYE